MGSWFSGEQYHGLSRPVRKQRPNIGKDVIQGCSETMAYVTDLEQQGMPCLQSKTHSRLEISERATARSMHAGGVNLLIADGSAVRR